jgi:hypothetical protein
MYRGDLLDKSIPHLESICDDLFYFVKRLSANDDSLISSIISLAFRLLRCSEVDKQIIGGGAGGRHGQIIIGNCGHPIWTAPLALVAIGRIGFIGSSARENPTEEPDFICSVR